MPDVTGAHPRHRTPSDATGTAAVSGIVLRAQVGGKATGEQRTLACDAIGMAGGWNPAIHLYSHSGGKVRWDADAACFVPGTAVAAQRLSVSTGHFRVRGRLRLDERVLEERTLMQRDASGRMVVLDSRRVTALADAP